MYSERSLLTQGCHRIYANGAEQGEGHCECSARNEREGRNAQDERISGGQSIQQALNHPRACERGNNPDEKAGDRGGASLPEDQPRQMCTWSADGSP